MVSVRSVAASGLRSSRHEISDGKLWFLTGEGVQVIDPHHLPVNKLPPPVRIEQIVADHKVYWQNITGAAVSNLRLPARIRDLQIDYTALSLVAPEKVHFKYMLEGQDSRLEGGGQRSPGAIHEPCSPPLPLSCDREQQ